MDNPSSLNTELYLDKELLESSVVHRNVGQEFVLTTSDKIRICLREHQEAIKAQNDWITPLGILLSLVASLVAADFKQFLGLTADIWKAMFIFGAIFCFAWLVYAIYLAFSLRKTSSIEHLIEKLKKSSTQ